MGNAQVANILRLSSNLSPQSLRYPRYPYPVILGADQKDRSLWERDCFSRNVYENLQVRFLYSPIHLLCIQKFHSISQKSFQTNKPWTRTTRSNTYNLGPELTVKRRNQRRLNDYRGKWMTTYRLTVLSSNFFHFSPATLDSSVTEMPGCSCLICARASFSHSMYADSDRLGAFASFLAFFFLLPSGFSA